MGANEYISPLVIKSRMQIGGQTPNGFGNKKYQDFNYNKPKNREFGDCPCSDKVKRECSSCASNEE